MKRNKRHGQAERTPPNRAQRGERGYVLLVFLLFSALLVIGLVRIMPKAVFEGQRQKEEELIFRGLQYQRAIQLFVRKFGRYPNSLEELEKTNEIRFLRRKYKDPMTKNGEWRLIHIGPGGVFTDAQTKIGSAGLTSVSSSADKEALAESFRASDSPSPAAGPVPTPLALPGSFEQVRRGRGPSQPGLLPGGPVGLTGAGPGQPAEPALRPSADPAANPAQQPRASALVQTGPSPVVFGGGGIAGVASQSTEESIKVLNGYSKYNEWEFVYDFRADPLGVAAIARVSGVPQQAPVAPPPSQPTLPQPPPFGLPPGVRPTPSPQPGQPGAPPPNVWPGFPPSPFPRRPGQR